MFASGERITKPFGLAKHQIAVRSLAWGGKGKQLAPLMARLAVTIEQAPDNAGQRVAFCARLYQ